MWNTTLYLHLHNESYSTHKYLAKVDGQLKIIYDNISLFLNCHFRESFELY